MLYFTSSVMSVVVVGIAAAVELLASYCAFSCYFYFSLKVGEEGGKHWGGSTGGEALVGCPPPPPPPTPLDPPLIMEYLWVQVKKIN